MEKKAVKLSKTTKKREYLSFGVSNRRGKGQYEYADAPDVEVYYNPDPVNAKYEVWIPVVRKDN